VQSKDVAQWHQSSAVIIHAAQVHTMIGAGELAFSVLEKKKYIYIFLIIGDGN
jgi:hypothetical protein